MLNKDKIHTYRTKKTIVTLAIGFVLGFFSAFLGIGGGPINLVALFYFFSMETKEAAENSLFIILFSQISSLFTTVITDTIPSVDMFLLVLMITGGILGGAIGKNINKRIDARAVEKLFMCLMIIIILISIYNLCKFYI